MSLHPDDALFDGGYTLPILPGCEHYAGNEQTIRASLARQAEQGPVFDVTCDLDDGAPLGGEADHVRTVAELIASHENAHGRVGVRLHSLSSAFWEQDVETLVRVAGERVAYLTLPKAETAEQVRRLAERVRALCATRSIDRSIPLHLLIETPRGLRNAWKMCAQPEVEAATLGSLDLIACYQGAIPAAAAASPLQFEHELVVHAKAQLALAALGNGAVPVHGVTLALKDAARTGADARLARTRFGFLRQVSVHPAQIDPIVEAMRPSHDEVLAAAEILLLAREQDWGPLEYAGHFEDRATYRHHWAVLRRAHAAGVQLPDDVVSAFFA